MKGKMWILLVGAVLIVSGCVGSSVTGDVAGPRVVTGGLSKVSDYSCPDCNVLFVTIDTLRADHVSAYGYPKKTTPVIDSVAEEGILFRNAFVQIPFTPASHWSIFTGTYPFNHQMFHPSGEGETDKFTLADLMGLAGYKTAAFLGSGMVSGLRKGFDTYDMSFMNDPRAAQGSGIYSRTANETTDAALDWLRENSGDRFLMWVHYWDPHSPYAPPEEFDSFDYGNDPMYADARYSQDGLGMYDHDELEGMNLSKSKKRPIREDIAKYDGEILFTDHELGRLLGGLEELGIEGNTLVVITADHGECFGEHTFDEFGYEATDPCLFHTKTLYEEEIHVPLVIRNPKSDMVERIGDMVESIDLMPTVLDMLNLQFDAEMDGHSLVPLIATGSGGFNFTVSQLSPVPGREERTLGIRTFKWKFVRVIPQDIDMRMLIAQQSGMGTDQEIPVRSNPVKRLLFNLDKDGDEMFNVYEREKDVAKLLEEHLMGIYKPGSAVPQTQAEEIDKYLIDQLKALGYIT